MGNYYVKGNISLDMNSIIHVEDYSGNFDQVTISAADGVFIEYVAVIYNYNSEDKHIYLKWDNNSKSYSVSGDYDPYITDGIVDFGSNYINIGFNSAPSDIYNYDNLQITGAIWSNYYGYIMDV